MNAPFRPDTVPGVPVMMAHASALLCPQLVDLADPAVAVRLEAFVAEHPDGTPFHRPAWLLAVAQGTGNRALALALEDGGEIYGFLPVNEIHSPLFGRLLASSGFAVGGGVLLRPGINPEGLFAALEELALRRSCPTIELRGGVLPDRRAGWMVRNEAHCGFMRNLAKDDEAELLAVPRKQRAGVRKGLSIDFTITVGRDARARAEHYAVYAESVRNLGTPVFPRALFAAVLDHFGDAADILTVSHAGAPVASVISLYHAGMVMPYWGGGTSAARGMHANDRMYFELMRHARAMGCTRFDFGRSKSGTGAYDFKRNWGFVPEPLAYGVWTMPGTTHRNADPASAEHARAIALWKRLPMVLANGIGPWIARGLG